MSNATLQGAINERRRLSSIFQRPSGGSLPRNLQAGQKLPVTRIHRWSGRRDFRMRWKLSNNSYTVTRPQRANSPSKRHD